MDNAFNISIGDNGYTDKDSMPAHIEFFTLMEKMAFESERQGKVIERPVTMIQFMFPGGKTIFPRKATEYDKVQYRKQWEQFQSNQVQIGNGLPLELWSAITEGQRLNLKSMHIHTVDQLANASDNDLAKIGMGALDLRVRARAYSEAQKGNAKTDELKEENQQLASQLDELKAQMAMMMEKMSSQSVEAPKKRGRPFKVDKGSGDDNT